MNDVLDRITREVDDIHRDAERYRWLRRQDEMALCAIAYRCRGRGPSLGALGVDRAIDEAMEVSNG